MPLQVVHVCYASSVLCPYCMLKICTNFILIISTLGTAIYISIHIILYVSTVGRSVEWCNVTVVGIGKAGSDTTRTKLIFSSLLIYSS